MKDLKNAFKPVPERFLYTIEQSVAEAQRTIKIKRRLPIKLIAVIAALLVAIPVGVFAAGQLSGMNVTDVGSYAVKFELDPSSAKASPKYVKLSITPPEDFIQMSESLIPMGNTYVNKDTYALMKDFSKGERALLEDDYTPGVVTFWLARPDSSKKYKQLFTNITNKEEREIGGRAVLFADDAGHAFADGKALFKFAVYYDNEVNILVFCLYSPSVERDTVAEFIEKSSVTKGTKADHTDFNEITDFIDDREPETNADDEEFATYDLIGAGEEADSVFGKHIKLKVDNIRYVDSISDMDRDDLFLEYSDYEYSDLFDADGNLVPQERENWNYGDGINTIDKLEKKEMINQKLLLYDVTYTNKGEKKKVIEPWGDSGEPWGDSVVEYLKSIDGKLSDKEDYPSVTGFVYIKDREKNKQFKLNPGESRTVTLGYIVDEDKIDEAYIVLTGSLASEDDNYILNYKAVKADG